MFEWRTTKDDRRFDADLERLVQGTNLLDEQGPIEEDLRTARVVVHGLAPQRAVSAEVRERAWRTVEARISAPRHQVWWRRLGAADQFWLHPSRVLVGATVMVMLVLGSVSPAGQQVVEAAVEAAQSAFKITMFRINPDGTTTPLEAEVLQVGNRIVVLAGMVSVDEAERQAGFSVRQPQELPAGARLLGAHVASHQDGTPDAWREVALMYVVGDELLTLVQARNQRPLPAPSGAPVLALVQAAEKAAPTGEPIKGQPKDELVKAEAVPLRTETKSVPIGSVTGTLQIMFTPDGEVMERTVTWKVGEMTYRLSGSFAEDELLRIAASILTS